ncbi:alanine dehydrogenase [Corynebacterium gerontici]|uniref:Alanine dehydrogenase n=1 Tax=Corynebacterium gerontici TaxID=2079234 RepID=A0A3G6J246_9CORY|nr:alanine dehydrogenase [Corynebacterium gerontici]AZA11966.1 Alanine dehydrogenase [Corynebacterium gerontici]
MRIGIPKEVMNREGRVALGPQGVRSLIADGHNVLVQEGAGLGAAMPDKEFEAAGATIVSVEEAWDTDLVLKVKEPQEQEFPYLRNQTLFTYLHLAACPAVADALQKAGTTSVAYETVTDAQGGLPLLAPMSQVAGRLAVIEGAHHLLSPQGGRGVLLSGVPGTSPAKVVVIGGGQVGASAVAMAHGLRAQVTVLDVNARTLSYFDDLYHGQVRTIISDPGSIREELLDADLVIGAVLVAGAKAPVLVPDSLVEEMKPGSVLVDVAIDQGGCFESSRKTSHEEPTFKVADSLMYCVPNMPGAVANTSTRALASATLPYVRALAEGGLDHAIKRYPGLAEGVMTREGTLVNETVAAALS